MSVVLHIGTQKTGTTSIQYWLRDHGGLLAQFGFRFPRGWLRLNTHLEIPLVLMRLDRGMNGRLRGDEWKDPDFRELVVGQVRDDLARHPDETTILSAEDLSLFRHPDEFIALRELVGPHAHVVLYLRKPADYLESLGRHYRKRGMPDHSDDPDAFNYMEPDSWLVDYGALVKRWHAFFPYLSVLSYDWHTREDGSVVPSFLRTLGMPVPESASSYFLNRRDDDVPRAEGNRLANGLPFGVEPDR